MPIQSMAGRQDLLLARKVEDVRQKVFELAAVRRSPMLLIPIPNVKARLTDLANQRGWVGGWRRLGS
jgi:hypothetical protein